MTCVCHMFWRIGRAELLVYCWFSRPGLLITLTSLKERENPVVRFKKKKEEALCRFWAGKEEKETK